MSRCHFIKGASGWEDQCKCAVWNGEEGGGGVRRDEK